MRERERERALERKKLKDMCAQAETFPFQVLSSNINTNGF